MNRRTILSLAAWLLMCPAMALAQDTTTILPASLLRRLAEVADGQRVANDVYLVARLTFPHEVTGVFTTRAEAQRAVRTPDFRVFGPIRATVTAPDLRKFFLVGCHHDGSRSVYSICPEGPIASLDDVLNVTITARLRSGDSVTKTYPARSIDAVFFTLDAMDKFAFDYYARLVGITNAAKMRDSVVARLMEPR